MAAGSVVFEPEDDMMGGGNVSAAWVMMSVSAATMMSGTETGAGGSGSTSAWIKTL